MEARKALRAMLDSNQVDTLDILLGNSTLGCCFFEDEPVSLIQVSQAIIRPDKQHTSAADLSYSRQRVVRGALSLYPGKRTFRYPSLPPR